MDSTGVLAPGRSTGWNDLGFALPFALALLPQASTALVVRGAPPGLACWLTVFVIFGILPVLDRVCGLETRDRDDTGAATLLRFLPLLALPVWLFTLVSAANAFVALPDDLGARIGWIVSIGLLGGILAINPAHELIHKPGALERAAGGLLLTSVGYFGFKVEHLRGHHVDVATPRDASTARLGESAWRFVLRALACNTRAAWRLEASRLRRTGRSPLSWRNEMIGWGALWLVAAVAMAQAFGRAGLIFFVAQGLIAAATLEVINYIEHYGLQRRETGPGRYERVTHLHSWNASQRLGNWLLFNLQRHSDHHAFAWRRYPLLRHHDDSPQLPAGYATMFVLALMPPLWHRIMDRRARAASGD
jgi:alkane 1-monooxygenase